MEHFFLESVEMVKRLKNNCLDILNDLNNATQKCNNTIYKICRNHTILSTLNARTLGPLGRLEELGANAESHGIDIIAVQEHRFYHPDNILKYHQVGSYQLVTSSASKNTVNSTVGGIGFLLSSKASDTLLSIESISPRIMVLEIDGNPKTTLVCVYSPHNSSVADEIENFYATLRSTIEQVPLHNFLVIAGDLNARLGSDETKFTFNSKTNRNGEMLKDFLEEFNLYTSSNSFMKPKGQLWTFESPLGDRAQIDYLIFRKKWRNSVKDSRSYSSFSSVGSDHRIVSATVKLSLRSSKKAKPHPMKMIDWEEVLSNPDMSKQFTIEVYNTFQSLSTSEIDAENIEEVYSSLIKSTEEVALATLPKRKSKAIVRGFNAIVQELPPLALSFSKKFNGSLIISSHQTAATLGNHLEEF
ncbi:craniofacial development protein 2-like [Octopus sinensis]|uniref:Craniofacial development protein 2-like n=1 Tax=Octopus sinensis TaxID=2607531 RepID=A0A6P7S6Q9_9MOLL|nr:craniofacial development protein 2-like [Octopus sinensis]